MEKLFYLSIFISLALSASDSYPKSRVSCAQSELNTNPNITTISAKLGYPLDVLRRIRQHRPTLFSELEMATISTDKEIVERYEVTYIYRGLALEPKDYNPEADKKANSFHTRRGEIYFAQDSSVAWNYGSIDGFAGNYDTYTEAYKYGVRAYGLAISLAVPKFWITEETFHYKGYNNFSFLRSFLGNESVFISDISYRKLTAKKTLEEVILSYQQFKKIFKRSHRPWL